MIGALIGKQEGRNIEVMNSFELLSHTVDERIHIDKEYYYTKEEQCEHHPLTHSLTHTLALTSPLTRSTTTPKRSNVSITVLRQTLALIFMHTVLVCLFVCQSSRFLKTWNFWAGTQLVVLLTNQTSTSTNRYSAPQLLIK